MDLSHIVFNYILSFAGRLPCQGRVVYTYVPNVCPYTYVYVCTQDYICMACTHICMHIYLTPPSWSSAAGSTSTAALEITRNNWEIQNALYAHSLTLIPDTLISPPLSFDCETLSYLLDWLGRKQGMRECACVWRERDEAHLYSLNCICFRFCTITNIWKHCRL